MTSDTAANTQTIKFSDEPLSPVMLITIGLMHVGAVAALFFPSTIGVASFLVLYVISAFGIVVGYHRLLSHRSFRPRKWVEYVLATCGALALQGGPGTWVAVHRLHHAHSDTDGDPHNARRGFLHAHVRWIFKKLPAQFYVQRYDVLARDIARDPYLRFLSEYELVPSVIIGLLLLAIGGWSAVLWGLCLRVVVVYHVTWLVNSAAHMIGNKPFPEATGRNNLLVALVTMGEGWHNNHHAFPRSARCGLQPWQPDFGWWLIAALEKLGLVDKVHDARDHLEKGLRKA